MSDDKEKISQDNEIETKEEAVELEVVEADDNSDKGSHTEETKKKNNIFLKRFEAVVIDQIFTGAVAYILLLAFDIVIRFGLGYYVENMVGMYLIFFIVCSIIYPLIIESTKFGNTIGRKFAGLKTVTE